MVELRLAWQQASARWHREVMVAAPCGFLHHSVGSLACALATGVYPKMLLPGEFHMSPVMDPLRGM